MRTIFYSIIAIAFSLKMVAQQNFVIHKANTRGSSDHGWLKANFSFSFADYYNPQKMGFGKLLVLNDDFIAGGKGFGTHPHDNMEIVTIPLEGALEHKDSKGNHGVINAGDIQIMSAGTGIRHSEYNASKTLTANTLQTWILPAKQNIEPRYDQKTFKQEDYKNTLKTVVSPSDPNTLHINQNAVYTIGKLEQGQIKEYNLRFKGNGVYVFIIDGETVINNQNLTKRDAIGIWATDKINIVASTNVHLLIIEVPME